MGFAFVSRETFVPLGAGRGVRTLTAKATASFGWVATGSSFGLAWPARRVVDSYDIQMPPLRCAQLNGGTGTGKGRGILLSWRVRIGLAPVRVVHPLWFPAAAKVRAYCALPEQALEPRSQWPHDLPTPTRALKSEDTRIPDVKRSNSVRPGPGLSPFHPLAYQKEPSILEEDGRHYPDPTCAFSVP